MIRRSIPILTTLLFLYSCSNNETKERLLDQAVKVVPSPSKVLKRSGNVLLSNSFWVVADVSDPISADLASYFVEQLNKIEGASAYITDLYSTRKHAQSIKLEIIDTQQVSAKGAYVLDITSSQIEIKSNTRIGIFNGIHTFLQLLDSSEQAHQSYQIKKMVIKDEPITAFRGVRIENQLSQENLLNLLSQMARLKLNLLVIAEGSVVAPEIQNLCEFYGVKISTTNLINNQSGWFEIEVEDLSNPSFQLNQLERVENILVKLPDFRDEVLTDTLLPIAEFCWTGKI